MNALVAELEACLASAEKAAVRFEGPALDAAISHLSRTMAALSYPQLEHTLDQATVAALQARLCAFQNLCLGLHQGLHRALLGAAESTKTTYTHLGGSDAKKTPAKQSSYSLLRRYG